LGSKSIADLKKLPWKSLLQSKLDNFQRQQLAQQAPASYLLPTGRQVLLKYEVGKPPVLEARIQEFFGLRETPRLAGGRVPLLLHLLAPNGRCQQITDDLASFWANTYPVVRKELRGRYPKHAWPEDPNARH
jgi:ATP-dependent helicase HrpB